MQVPPPPSAPLPPAPLPPAPPPMVSPPRGRRVGAAVLVALVGAALGVAMLMLAGLARSATVEGFARAPVGCTTTLQFDREGIFTLYLETKGTVTDVDGDCALNGDSYDHDGSQVSVETDLTAEDGTSIAVESVDLTRRYDTGGFRGRSIGIAKIASPGQYRLTVRSDTADVVVAVGGAPDVDSKLLQLGGVATLVLGLLVAALVAGTGRRRPPPPVTRPVPPVRPMAPPPWGPPSV